jgi:hypothetical protein
MQAARLKLPDMSELAEGPFPGNNHYFSQDCRRAYDEFLTGIVTKDIADLHYSANILYNSFLPLSESFHEEANILEKAILEAKQADYLKNSLPAFRMCVQSYVYSGLRISAEPILEAKKFLDVCKREMRGIILPNRQVPAEVAEFYGYNDEKYLRTLGEIAVIGLGVATPRTVLRHEFLHLIGKPPVAGT